MPSAIKPLIDEANRLAIAYGQLFFFAPPLSVAEVRSRDDSLHYDAYLIKYRADKRRHLLKVSQRPETLKLESDMHAAQQRVMAWYAQSAVEVTPLAMPAACLSGDVGSAASCH